MKAKSVFLVILASLLVLATYSGSQAANTKDIDSVRSKGVLDSKDFQIIDGFVAEAVKELVETSDFTSVAKLRTAIVSKSKSEQSQYAEQFSTSARKYIEKGLKTASALTPESRQFNTILNLLILIDNLENPRLVEPAMGLLNDKNKAICYWAVHSLTNPGIIKQLNSSKTANSKLTADIAAKLSKLVESVGPETIALMVGFAAAADVQQGDDLLLQIADMRISRYADWTVNGELLDSDILRVLYEKISSSSMNKTAYARRFGQLYSYAMQRYIKGKDILSTDRKEDLASVLVETEQSYIGKILGVPQTSIKRAIEQSSDAALSQEYGKLFGDEKAAGQLALKLNFDYGKNTDGSNRTVPLTLPELL